MGVQDPDEAGSTVEWGEADDRRSRWWDRIVGREPQGGAGRSSGVNAAAVICAALAFVVALAAVALPWLRIGPSTGGLVAPGVTMDRMALGQILSFLVPAYAMSLVLAFGCVSALLVAPAGARRLLSAVAFGLIAGQLACVVGLGAAIEQGGDLVRIGEPNVVNAVSAGEGVYAAAAAAVLLAAAVVLANRQPRRRRRVRLRRRPGRRGPRADRHHGDAASSVRRRPQPAVGRALTLGYRPSPGGRTPRDCPAATARRSGRVAGEESFPWRA